jgi:hypothetical protein
MCFVVMRNYILESIKLVKLCFYCYSMQKSKHPNYINDSTGFCVKSHLGLREKIE